MIDTKRRIHSKCLQAANVTIKTVATENLLRARHDVKHLAHIGDSNTDDDKNDYGFSPGTRPDGAWLGGHACRRLAGRQGVDKMCPRSLQHLPLL